MHDRCVFRFAGARRDDRHYAFGAARIQRCTRTTDGPGLVRLYEGSIDEPFSRGRADTSCIGNYQIVANDGGGHRGAEGGVVHSVILGARVFDKAYGVAVRPRRQQLYPLCWCVAASIGAQLVPIPSIELVGGDVE